MTLAEWILAHFQNQAEQHAARKGAAALVKEAETARLTKADVSKILERAHPGLVEHLSSEETRRLLICLHNANKISGRGSFGKSISSPPKWLLQRKHLSLKTPAKDRIENLKELGWWPHVVEAMYRGEWAAEKLRRTNDPKALGYGASLEPSEEAYIIVGEAIGLGSDSVHNLVKMARSIEREFGSEEIPPMRVAEYKRWLRDGGSLFSEPG